VGWYYLNLPFRPAKMADDLSSIFGGCYPPLEGKIDLPPARGVLPLLCTSRYNRLVKWVQPAKSSKNHAKQKSFFLEFLPIDIQESTGKMPI
jgi:hypothetical protein